MLIRAATVEDARAIGRVNVESWRAAYRHILPEHALASLTAERPEERAREVILQPDCGRFFYVGEDDAGQVVGFAVGGPERDGDPNYAGELYAIYILPDRQRRGMGRGLAIAIARRLASEGMDSMLVWALKANPARAFYEMLGGVLLRERYIEIGGVVLPEVAYGWLDTRTFRRGS